MSPHDDDASGSDTSHDSSSKGSRFPDAVRKAVFSGISALFVTEEGIRNAVSDMRLPKDAMSYLMQQTDKTRRELFRVVSHEVKGFLRNADLTGEVRRALVGLKVQVRAEIKFSHDEPDVSVKGRIKRPRHHTGPLPAEAAGKTAATGATQTAEAPKTAKASGAPEVTSIQSDAAKAKT